MLAIFKAPFCSNVVSIEPEHNLLIFFLQQIQVNVDARTKDQSREHDPFGDHLVFVMMQHLQRQRV